MGNSAKCSAEEADNHGRWDDAARTGAASSRLWIQRLAPRDDITIMRGRCRYGAKKCGASSYWGMGRSVVCVRRQEFAMRNGMGKLSLPPPRDIPTLHIEDNAKPYKWRFYGGASTLDPGRVGFARFREIWAGMFVSPTLSRLISHIVWFHCIISHSNPRAFIISISGTRGKSFVLATEISIALHIFDDSRASKFDTRIVYLNQTLSYTPSRAHHGRQRPRDRAARIPRFASQT